MDIGFCRRAARRFDRGVRSGQRHPLLEPDLGDGLQSPAFPGGQKRLGRQPNPERQGQGSRSRRAAAHHWHRPRALRCQSRLSQGAHLHRARYRHRR